MERKSKGGALEALLKLLEENEEIEMEGVTLGAEELKLTPLSFMPAGEAKPAPPEKKFCPNCGLELPSDAGFCPTCGSKL